MLNKGKHKLEIIKWGFHCMLYIAQTMLKIVEVTAIPLAYDAVWQER
jgi:hypothetical protein